MATRTGTKRHEPVGTAVLEQIAELDVESISPATARKFLGFRQYVYGLAYSATIAHVGVQSVLSGGYEDYSQVYGREYVSSGGTGYADTVYAGGRVDVYAGGFDEYSYIGSGGREFVWAGASAYYDAVASGGVLNDYGFLYDTTIYAGGTAKIFAGGSEDYSQIYGVEIVLSGGAAYYDTVYSGGQQALRGYGFAYDTTILSGGVENIKKFGSDDYSQIYGVENLGGSGYADTVYSGGKLNVLNGGVETSGLVESGGKATVVSGGTFTSGVDYGVLTVSSGGHVSGGLTISGGGTASISGSVAAGQSITLAGNGETLALYAVANFHATIGGFSTSDRIDLGGFSYSASETFTYTEAASLLSGTLSVNDGVQSANLTLLGNYTSANFALANDGHGGTYVKYV